MQDSNKTYFAARPPKETADVLLNKAKSFYNYLEANFYLEKLKNSWKFYHGAYDNNYGFGHSIQYTGEQGELLSFPVNHYRNIGQHMLNMICANRPSIQARAVNTDYKSLAQTYLANGILDYYMRQKHLEDCLKTAVELAIVLGAGFVKLAWNSTGGQQYDFDEESGTFSYEGELEFTTCTPFDVVVDGTKEKWDNDWILVRSWVNKYNLIAKYPELADEIYAVESKQSGSVFRLNVFSNDDTDDIAIYEFFHKKTEAVPDGRYIQFLDKSIVLFDGNLPYRQIPVFRISAGEILGTPYGYTPLFDCYPLQEAANALYSSILTNQNAFAVQNLWVPRGADLNVNTLVGAMNIIEGNQGFEPKPMNFTQTPPEVFKFLETVIQSMETVSGINSVTRGNPETSLKSGNALALVQSMAIQFLSGLQQSYVELIENVGSALIDILKDFAITPKTISVIGKNNRYLAKEFTGDDINAISRVTCDVGNALAACLKYGTPILMFDGTIKEVQDIRTGDILMGPDSKPRTVENVNSGTEMMYEVSSRDPRRNISYGCNKSHILTLKYCSDDERYNAKKGDIVDISVGEYLKLPSRQQRILQGFTTGVEFSSSKKLYVPPYILGLWLGDGNTNNTSLTSMDHEIVEEWTNYAHSIGMQIRVTENHQPNKSKNYFITSGQMHGPSDRNPFMNELRAMEVIKNKHIPHAYLVASRKDRLELLAGLIDTDGSRVDRTLIFTQKNEKLIKQVQFLAQSLGFRTSIQKIKSFPSDLVSVEREAFKLSIGGNTHEIPVRLPRKRCVNREIKQKDPLNYGIKVSEVGEGTYYGFTLKEEPHFILGDSFTVTHNTTAGRVQMAEQLLQMGLITNPQEYIQVLNTGNLTDMFEGNYNELMLIKAENEKLMEGSPVTAAMIDAHKEHIMEHKAVLADPDLRDNGPLVQQVLAHIQEHINFLRTADPQLLQLIGEQPLQPPPMQPPGGQLPPGPMNGPPQPPPKGLGQMVRPINGPGQPPPAMTNGVMQSPNGIPPQVAKTIANGQNPNAHIPRPASPPSPFHNAPTNPAESTALKS